MTEHARHFRALAQRTPAEHAFYAFAALSWEDKCKAVEMFNATFIRRAGSGQRLSIEKVEA